MSRVLVVDDEPAIVTMFRHIFSNSEIEIASVTTGSECLRSIRVECPDVVMIDIVLPDGNGLDVFEQIKQIDSQLPVVIMTGGQDSQVAITAMQNGAFDYLVKPLDVRSLNKIVRQAIEVRRLMVEPIELEPDEDVESGTSMIGSSSEMREVYKAIGRVASQNISVLIRGESGTGKELVARAIFQNGSRSDKPFIALNCAAIPDALLESELFGHEKGAFTGADRRRIGKIEQCDGGTLFLDEIGDMKPALQSKLLRVLQQKQFERVGGTETIDVDVRFLAATHRDIESMCRSGKFREDLYYRLNGYPIFLPPLRDRENDIETLIEYFRKSANRELKKDVVRLAPDALEILCSYYWPGNVRQLQSVIHQAIIQSTGSVLLADFLPELPRTHDEIVGGFKSRDASESRASSSSNVSLSNQEESLADLINRHRGFCSPTLFDDVIEEVERALISAVLSDCNGNLTEASKVLGITRTTVRTKINKLGIGIYRTVDRVTRLDRN